MDKNEILAKSRKENSKQDEFYAQVNKSAVRLGLITVVIICLVLMITEYAVYGKLNSGYIVIMTAVNATVYLYQGIKLKDKAFITAGAVWLFVTIMDVVNYIIALVG